jgi:transcriptional regulator with XRE-family HTH domain
MKENMNIGKTIKTLREDKGISQNKLAELLNVTPQAISKWENNMNSPDISLLPQLADIFGVSIDTIFDYADQNRIKRIQEHIDNEYVMSMNEFVQAMTLIEKQMDKEPDALDNYLVLGNLCLSYAEELNKKAVHYGKHVLSVSLNNEAALNIVHRGSNGYYYDWKKNSKVNLIKLYEKINASGSDNATLYTYLIESLIYENEYHAALHFINKSKNVLSPVMQDIYRYIIKHNHQEITDISEIIKISRDGGFYENYVVGSFLAEKRQYEAAIDCWYQAYEFNQSFLDPLEQIASCYAFLGRYEDAIRVNEKMISVIHNEWKVKENRDTVHLSEQINEWRKNIP